MKTGDRVPEKALFFPRRAHRAPVAPIFEDVSLTVSERPKQGEEKVMKFTLTSKIKP